MFVSEYMSQCRITLRHYVSVKELAHQQKATPLLVHILCQHHQHHQPHQLHQQQLKVMGKVEPQLVALPLMLPCMPPLRPLHHSGGWTLVGRIPLVHLLMTTHGVTLGTPPTI